MKPWALFTFSALLIVGGCAEQPPVVVLETPQPPIRIVATGYGAESNYVDYSPGQRRLMAIRAAKTDAYRALAEQLYGTYVMGHTHVNAAALQTDSARIYVDTFVRGARVLEITPTPSNTYEVTLEAMFDRQFFDCLNDPYRPGCPPTTRPSYQPAYLSSGALPH